MKSIMKLGSVGLVISMMTASYSTQTAHASFTTPEVYVALGDSIAAGATPYEALDAGYTDIIANKLAQNGLLAAFSKDFSVPGFSTAQILELLETDEVRQGIEQATMITLSAGANNVLGLVQQDDGGKTIQFNQLTANFALNQMRIQYGEILDEIQSINPDAKIYAVGYYFPYPHVLETQQQGVRKMLSTVNTIIENEANSKGITFIDVSDQFNENGMNYLPNPTDVHPNQEGYTSMADSFFEQVDPRFDVTSSDIPPNPGISPFLEQLMSANGMNSDEIPAVNEEAAGEDATSEEENNSLNEEEAALGPIPSPSLKNPPIIYG